MTGNNPNLALTNINQINPYIKFGKILSICSQNKILTSIKGYNSVTNVPKMMHTNHNIDLVNINAYIKFGENLSICSQDIEHIILNENLTSIKGHNTALPPPLYLLAFYVAFILPVFLFHQQTMSHLLSVWLILLICNLILYQS